MEKLRVISFYKYTDLPNIVEFAKEHLALCKKIGLMGRTVVATEGINGTVSGTPEQIEEYKNWLSNDSRFTGIEFKEDDCLVHPFKWMKIKVKNELVRFGQPVSHKDAGEHLSPKEFLAMSKEEDVILLDARNDYEVRVGKFKNAVDPEIETFREFPKVVKKLEDKKDKKILMYCTGGIRCEKASAFMKKEGFSKVYQLHGGILNFGKECPDTIWEGKCFVFDKRLISTVNNEENPISVCDNCNTACDLYRNCRNRSCDKLTVACIECEKKLGGCCSKKCFNELFKMNPIAQ